MCGRRFVGIDDERLVLWSLLGSLEAFDELVRRFRGAVRLVAEQELGSREAAEDVTQEAFLLAFKSLPQLKELSRFPGWLYAITRHRARRVAARERISEPVEPSQLDQLVLSCSHELVSHPAEELARSSECASIRDALAGLPAEYRTVLQLHYCEEWSVRRIANFLLLPMTTVKWRMHHGRRLLRTRLTETLSEKPEENDDERPAQ